MEKGGVLATRFRGPAEKLARAAEIAADDAADDPPPGELRKGIGVTRFRGPGKQLEGLRETVRCHQSLHLGKDAASRHSFS